MESEDMFMKRKGLPSFFSCALISISALLFGGTALAATAPDVAKLVFKDTKGTVDLSDDTIVTMSAGYMPYRVATDAVGDVYVTDPELNAVYKYNTNGHLVRTYRVNVPRGVAVNDVGDIYVGGVINGSNAIFVFGQSGAIKGTIGQNGKIAADIEVDSTGNIFVIDSSGAVITVLNKDGVVSNTFGPYEDRYNGPETIAGVSYARTRHRLASARGIATGESDIYVVYKEYVDYLTNSTTSTGCSSGYSVDTTAYLNYSNTDASYQYWCGAAAGSAIAVIDKWTGIVKNRIQVDGYVSSSNTTSTVAELNPQGIALDNNGRLYVGTTSGVKVYDAATGAALVPTGAFDSSCFLDLSFDAKNGRVLGTTGNMLLAYGIDGGSNPVNTPPDAPALLSPSNKTYAGSRTPLLKVSSAADREGDPLTYGYEIKDISGNPIAGFFGVPQGSDGETAMQVNYLLEDNTRYTWRAQAFDANASGDWSAEAEFCVNERNDSPTTPVVVAPKGSDIVSPFSSVLTWLASIDPDCYDFISYYSVEVSSDPAFSSVQSFTVGGASIKLADVAKGFTAGGSYYWRVKAVDNNGGESAYSSGSFVYKTTLVRFESELSGAKVYIDGNYGYLGRPLGTVPTEEVQDIIPGSHFVAFTKAGYDPYYAIVDVKEPLVEDGVLVVSATSDKWIKASKIRPSASGSELFKTSGNSTPFVVDYNNDGLKDVIAGDADGNIYLYLSEEQTLEDGSKKVVLVAKGALQNINVGSRAVPFAVDYNNDGKKDLLVGSGDGYIYLYLNEAEDSAPAFILSGRIKDVDGQDIKVDSNSAPTIIDYDNDGRKELVVGSSDGTLRLYANKGFDEAPKFDAVYSTINADGSVLTATSSSSVFFTDWNNDGKKDIIVGGSSLHLYLNVGSDDAPNFLSLTHLQAWIKDKKRERGNREFIPYLGYNADIDYVNGVDLIPFVVDWSGTSARDLVVGGENGSMTEYQAE